MSLTHLSPEIRCHQGCNAQTWLAGHVTTDKMVRYAKTFAFGKNFFYPQNVIKIHTSLGEYTPAHHISVHTNSIPRMPRNSIAGVAQLGFREATTMFARKVGAGCCSVRVLCGRVGRECDRSYVFDLDP